MQTEPLQEREAFVNALTTNLTAFFREPHHFELLHQRARSCIAGRERRPMRVWCSACATGEEAWSIAMTLREAGCPADIVASDIDTDALGSAAAAVYPMERAEGLAPERLRAHLLRGTGDNAGWVSLRPELRAMVRFMQFNLQSAPWPAMEPFDAIFCRNVAIYFDREAQKKLLARFAAALRPHGLLAVGHAESFPARQPLVPRLRPHGLRIPARLTAHGTPSARPLLRPRIQGRHRSSCCRASTTPRGARPRSPPWWARACPPACGTRSSASAA